MPEAGGTTTHSGILYQDIVAASFLSEMLGGAALPRVSQIIEVRVESRTTVDDVVVRLGDEHHIFAQAKESVDAGGSIWRDVWRDFLSQYRQRDFGPERDWLYLYVGSSSDALAALSEALERTEGTSSLREWTGALSVKQQDALRSKVFPLLPRTDFDILAFLKRVRIEIRHRRPMEVEALRLLPAAVQVTSPREGAPSIEVPVASQTVFRLLVPQVLEQARRRVPFTPDGLRTWLSSTYQIRFTQQPTLDEIHTAVQRCGAPLRGLRNTIGATGHHVPQSVTGEIVNWLLVTSPTSDKDAVKEQPHGVTLGDNIAVLLDGAGRGKTVVMHDVLAKLEEERVTTLAIKADRQLNGLGDGRAIHQCEGVRLPLPVEQVVLYLARAQRVEGRPVVVLLDQVDALSQSMARDTSALNAVLNLVSALRGVANVRVLMACRAFDLKTTPALSELDIKKKFLVPLLADEDVEQVLNLVGVVASRLTPPTRKLLRTPLHLHIFVEALQEGEAAAPAADDVRSLNSLQDLYDLLWHNRIEAHPLEGAPVPHRVAVLKEVTASMARTQKTTVPNSLLHQIVPGIADGTATRLASEHLARLGILVEGVRECGFLHQTFFDYCLARFFVEDGRHLAAEVLPGPQGLSERPLLIHVLSYLRTTDEALYGREMEELGSETFFERDGLRAHLRDLLRKWFGTVRSINTVEWNLGRRYLADSTLRPLFLQTTSANPEWCARLLASHIPLWLRQLEAQPDDQLLANQISFVLRFQEDSTEVQSTIVALLRPYLHRSEMWDSLIANYVFYIRHWGSIDAVKLYGELLPMYWDDGGMLLYELTAVAKQHPTQACSIVRTLLSLALTDLQKDVQARRESKSRVTLYDDIFGSLVDRQSQGLKIPDEALDALAESVPAPFLDAAWPFFIAVLPLQQQVLDSPFSSDDDLPFYRDDSFHSFWESRTSRGVMFPHTFGSALMSAMDNALKRVAEQQPDDFARFQQLLLSLDWETPQMLLLDAYCVRPEQYSREILDFLCTDRRRLSLGEKQFETRRLMRAVLPYWSQEDVLRLERAVMEAVVLLEATSNKIPDGWPDYAKAGLWRLLRTLGDERLSLSARDILATWDVEFDDWGMEEEPVTSAGGFVGPPLEGDVSVLSDDQWLEIMAQYAAPYSDGASFEFVNGALRGGAEQLARYQLKPQVTAQPERFVRLALERLPSDARADYVCAIVEGLADSVAPVELLCSVVHRFATHRGLWVAQTLARCLNQRAGDGLPLETMTLLEKWVRGRVEDLSEREEDEAFHTRQQERKDPSAMGNNGRSVTYDTVNGGPWMDFHSSTRGNALAALLSSLAASNNDEARWRWVEELAGEPVGALRAGALEELNSLAGEDPERAMRSFERLLDGHPSLLRSHSIYPFLNWAIYRFAKRVEPYLSALREDPFANVAQQGAALTCVYALREEGSTGDAHLLDVLLNGPPAWRLGVAEVLSNSIRNLLLLPIWPVCVDTLSRLFDDDDDQVRFRASRFGQELDEMSFEAIGPLFERYVHSRSLGQGSHWNYEYLLRCGDQRPLWTLEQVGSIIENLQRSKRTNGGWGGEKLVSCVLHLYTLPGVPATGRESAITLFGRLLDFFPHDAEQALREWDEGRYP